MSPTPVVPCTSPNCRAPVVWRENQTSGKRAPIDPEPLATGNVVLDAEGRYRVLTKAELAQLDGPQDSLFPSADAPVRYVSHFVTCADPDHFRRCKRCHHTPCECAE